MACCLSLLSCARHSTTLPSLFLSRKPPPSQHFIFPIRLKKKRHFSFVVSLGKSDIDGFQRWLEGNGVRFPVVKPEVVAEGLGLVAHQNVGRNDVVVEVPQRIWINMDTVAASDIGRVVKGSKPWVRIALFLLREMLMGQESDWSPYLRILPKRMNSTIYWSVEELAELEGTQLLSTTLSVKEYVETEFNKARDEVIVPHSHLFPNPITLADFLWVFGILRSRAFSQHRGENLVLIPLADLINHSSSITTEDIAWQIKGSGLFSRELVFSLRAPFPIKAGEQVYIQYDLKKSNAELALDYGFIEPNPDRDVYTLTLEIPESDPFYVDKLDIAELNGLGTTAYFDIVLGQPLPESLLPYLRLVALGGMDAFLLEALFRDTIWGHLQLPVSRTNEELICKVVIDSCQDALSGYKTTIAEDEELKERNYLDRRLQIAIGIRAAEKKVLHHILGVFKERETELEKLEYYQERRLRDLGLVGEAGEIIFWESK